MKIVLNGKEYQAPEPLTGLWFMLQKLKTEHAQRVEAIRTLWKRVEPLEKDELSDAERVELDELLVDCAQKTAENQRALMEAQIEAIVAAFRSEKVTRETILEHLPLADVRKIAAEIDDWIGGIVAGRAEKLPNE